MANEKNLKPFGSGGRTESEERKLQSEGGKKSGASRRQKKSMQQAAKALLDMPANKATAARLKKFGVSEEDATFQMAIMLAMITEAAQGNVKAATFLRDTAGENPQTKLHSQELKLKKDELKHQRELEAKEAAKENTTSTWADAVLEAYQVRRKNEGEDDEE